MKEIINIQVGQCGNQLGTSFWQNVCREHGVEPTGEWTGDSDLDLERIEVCFAEGPGNKFVPRAVLVDLEPGPLDAARARPYGQLFRPDNIVCDSCGAGGNWAKGFYTEGAEKVDEVLDCLRKEAEMAESLQGFQLCHSLGGGTGAGLGALIMTKVKEEYPDRIFSTFSVFPSFKVSDSLIEPYNAGFSIHYLTEYADTTFCIDNEALYDICFRMRPSMGHLTHTEMNYPVATCMSDVTASLRFPGNLNTDLRKLATNLVPYPRLHFLISNFAPLIPRTGYQSPFTVAEMTEQIFDVSNVMASCDPRLGKYLSAVAIYRGRCSMKEIDDVMFDVTNKEGNKFAEWIPQNVMTTTCAKPPGYYRNTSTLIANNTSIQDVFTRTMSAFSHMFRRKTFLFRFREEGVDDTEFTEAWANVTDLVSEYQQRQDATSEEPTNEEVEDEELGDDLVIVDNVDHVVNAVL